MLLLFCIWGIVFLCCVLKCLACSVWLVVIFYCVVYVCVAYFDCLGFDLDFVAVLLLLRCLRLFGVCLGLFVVIYGLLRWFLLIYFVGGLVVFVGYVGVLFGLGVYFELLFDLWYLI